MAETLLGALKEMLDNEVKDVERAIISGPINKIEDLTHLRGILRGLNTAYVVVEKLEKNLNEENEDD